MALMVNQRLAHWEREPHVFSAQGLTWSKCFSPNGHSGWGQREWANGWIDDGQTDGRLDRRMDGWMDARRDDWKPFYSAGMSGASAPAVRAEGRKRGIYFFDERTRTNTRQAREEFHFRLLAASYFLPFLPHPHPHISFYLPPSLSPSLAHSCKL